MTWILGILAYMFVGTTCGLVVCIHAETADKPVDDEDFGTLAFLVFLWPAALAIGAFVGFILAIQKSAAAIARRARKESKS